MKHSTKPTFLPHDVVIFCCPTCPYVRVIYTDNDGELCTKVLRQGELDVLHSGGDGLNVGAVEVEPDRLRVFREFLEGLEGK